MIRFTIRVAALAGLAAALTSAAHAAVLYDNGPVNGEINAYTINYGYAVSDSFTLTSASTITGVDFGVWALPGDTFETVDWAIAAAPDTYPGGPTAAVTTGAITVNSLGAEVSTDSFSTGAVALGPGTYYLVLQNAVVDTGDGIGWDENDGPSTASENAIGALGSESFQILGTASGVPEASAWAMMLAGLGGLGVTMRSRRSAATAA